MNGKIYLLATVAVFFSTVSVAAYADMPAGPLQNGVIMGGGGHGGGMGGGGHGGGMGGHGMMGWGRGLSTLWEYLSKKPREPDQNPYAPKDTEALRAEIKEKRKELDSMLASSNKDEEVINRKIDELNRLELELDIRLREQGEKGPSPRKGLTVK